jgi:hypothetical protein
VAPWNYSRYEIGRDADGHVTADSKRLVFYHYHQFQILEDGRFHRLSSFYTNRCREPEEIYQAYETAIGSALLEVRGLVPEFSEGILSGRDFGWRGQLLGQARRVMRILFARGRDGGVLN